MVKILNAKDHDIGGIFVKRFLPQVAKRMVGPFIFFDQMGPGDFPAGKGINVRPHPHIGLSTLTYLFDGSILHRDSLGNNLEIHPGDVNWMTAGRGIVHSERESHEVRANPHSIYGLQCWVALPRNMAELEPSFINVKKERLPQLHQNDIMIRLIVGEAYGLSSPIKTYSPMFYLDIIAPEGGSIDIPSETQETAIYLVFGKVIIGGETFTPGQLLLLEPDEITINFMEDSRIIMIGGDAFDEVPYIYWNFVSFDKARIEQAKDDWKNRLFPVVPDDDIEFIPL